VTSVLGVDLGATNLRVALGDASGAIAARAGEPVPGSGAELADRVALLGRSLADSAGVAWADVRGAAVGVPGVPVGEGFEGFIAGAAGLNGAPLRSLLGDALGVPVVLENDLNLAALAEHRARGVRDLAFIGIGTGVGMGVVLDGRLLRGATGAAGELGHLPMAGAPVAGPDGLGPLEAVAGGAGLAARWGGPAVQVFTAAGRGNPRAAALLLDQAQALATAIRAVAALLDPALVVLGGGIGSRQDVLERVRSALAAHGRPAPAVEVSALGEDAGLVGALTVAGR
jgi:predicted NBD/HSP70 family sugar kinase